MRVSDPALTESFFAFANFYKARTGTPKEAGVGYEITRYYVDQNREVAFDRLHYYPDTGFVYYDGIVGGSSEYDRKWYLANAETKTVFENSLATSVVTPLGVPIDPFIAVIVVVVTLLGYAVWRSKFSTP